MKQFYLFSLVFAVVLISLGSCKEDPEDAVPTPTPSPLVCQPTVTDIDGNNYTVVKIGERCWMKENLKTTRYNDGTEIITGLSATQWADATVGAYAIYDDDEANDMTYGKLYNGHAVATNKLCPLGWHIPTDEEFNEMEKYLGMSDAELLLTGERGNAEEIGGKMKALVLWDEPNAGATDSSGFSALPAGTRNAVGDYIVIKQYATFWTSTVYPTDDNFLWNHHLYYNGTGVGRIFQSKEKGYSCRCIKD